ncbi:uncharacterized protein BX663DRAFT_507489 [Cokeromyces recurvatus]|uniref:uncharacterized protein n=1 Tax=Cokeromyces recurvatus TaxID=90255 RepID=UPI0022203862|nr:uncharacterized protein BX663DRAFT_507489 [Cokeromyces recurvatus]KAI7903759.1 hypothetical protein BX663DRAFT_507489 [Cokeromyces recurvatus]
MFENKNVLKRDSTNGKMNCDLLKTCSKDCYPACSSTQICTYQITSVTECSTCPVTFCVEKNQVQQLSSSTLIDYHKQDSKNNNTALVAGLTTGLVVATLIIVTIGGFVLYRRRKWKKILKLQEEDEKRAYIPPYPPRIVSEIQNVLPPPPPAVIVSSSSIKSDNSIPPPIPDYWNQQTMKLVENDHPQSPFLIGAHNLQIPHLDTTIPDPSSLSNKTRRSLYIPATTTHFDHASFLINRSSSVKVSSKYDNRHYNISKEDDSNEPVKIRRAVSVKKNNSTASHSSSITRVGSYHDNDDGDKKYIYYAQPRMVHISTITSSNEKGIVSRKRSIRTIASHESPLKPFNISLTDNPPNNNENIDIYYNPPSMNTSSTCTLADGEITVFLEPNQ